MRFLYLTLHKVIYVGGLSFEEVSRRAEVRGLKAERLSEGRIVIIGQYWQLESALIDVTKRVFQPENGGTSVSFSGRTVLGLICPADDEHMDHWPQSIVDTCEEEDLGEGVPDDGVSAEV